MHPLNRSFLAVAIFGALAPASFGATIAYTGTGATKGGAVGNLNIGREFSVAAGGITISDLGVFDFGSDGLVASHDVTLFSITGSGGANPAPETALTSVTVPGGTAATLESAFRFAPITPIFLPAGNYAVIAYGTDAGGDPYGDGGGVPSAPVAHLGFDPYQFTGNTSPSFPTGGDGGNHSSASFHFDAGNTTPEPGSLTVLAVGALALGRRRRV